MQRQPGPPNAPGFAPMQPGFGGPVPPPGQPFVPMRRPSGAGPCFGPVPHPQQPPMQGSGCFMPAANIRKMSNTNAPPQFFNPPN